MPRVHNKHHGHVPRGAVSVMRDGKWGNPWHVGKDGSREDVIARHRDYLFQAIRARGLDLEHLRGKDLLCCCKPKACHGDIIFILANTDIF